MTPRRSSLAGENIPNGEDALIPEIRPLIDMMLRHAWLSYMVDAPPTQDKILQTGLRAWELPEHRPNLTLSRGAYKTYSTLVSPYSSYGVCLVQA
jgi:hypothetical protein